MTQKQRDDLLEIIKALIKIYEDECSPMSFMEWLKLKLRAGEVYEPK